MIKSILSAIAISVMLATGVQAQEKVCETPAQFKTQIEAFSASTGREVRIFEYSGTDVDAIKEFLSKKLNVDTSKMVEFDTEVFATAQGEDVAIVKHFKDGCATGGGSIPLPIFKKIQEFVTGV